MPTKEVWVRRKLLAVGVIAIGSLVGFAATQTAIAETPKTQVESQVEAAADWAPATKELNFALPPGVDWPTTAPQILREFEAYEDGFADGLAALYWMCAWETQLLASASASDPAGVDSALSKLQSFARSAVAAELLEGVGVWSTNVLVPAAAGDLKPLTEDASTLCVGFPEIGAER
jgi:hypothetical protein